MSSSERRIARRAALGLLALGALALAGCGFQPVYAPGGAGDVRGPLSRLEVQEQKGNAAFATRNALLDALGAPDKPADPEHFLRLEVLEDRESAGIQADETVSRINVSLTGHWWLLAADRESVLDSGSERRTVSYNVVDDEYATLIAGREASEQAGRLVGEAIRTRLLFHFTRN
ncbi:MAG: hypothetical protein TEF_01190 [Rhizobiales bacterium NRL2]|jgi:LPS-assembly lipoprotein|nr:MAG: hypothetical protein TEF_01190 [Rhizobiales bacterium NRL2]